MPREPRELKHIVSRIVTRSMTPHKHGSGDWFERRAEEMRIEKPPAEELLWEQIGEGQRGYECLAQVVIGPYIADFVVPLANLVIELDGWSHDKRTERDWLRTHELIRRGYDIRRFANDEIYRDMTGVLARIDLAVYELLNRGVAIHRENMDRYGLWGSK